MKYKRFNGFSFARRVKYKVANTSPLSPGSMDWVGRCSLKDEQGRIFYQPRGWSVGTVGIYQTDCILEPRFDINFGEIIGVVDGILPGEEKEVAAIVEHRDFALRKTTSKVVMEEGGFT